MTLDIGLWTSDTKYYAKNQPASSPSKTAASFAGAPGLPRAKLGEMVFNTSMTGYQEVLTDPSYAGQIVCMTYPLIGNYGVNSEDEESAGPGLKVRRPRSQPHGFQLALGGNARCISETLEHRGDRWHRHARAGRHIRDKGAMRACLSTIDLDEESLIEKARQSPPMENRELASVVTTKDLTKFRRTARNVFTWSVTTLA